MKGEEEDLTEATTGPDVTTGKGKGEKGDWATLASLRKGFSDELKFEGMRNVLYML